MVNNPIMPKIKTEKNAIINFLFSVFITDAIIQVYARNGEFDLTDIDDPSEAMANATLRAVTTPVPSGATPDTQTGTDTEVTD